MGIDRPRMIHFNVKGWESFPLTLTLAFAPMNFIFCYRDKLFRDAQLAHAIKQEHLIYFIVGFKEFKFKEHNILFKLLSPFVYFMGTRILTLFKMN
jgi:hypothetical protein